MLDRYGQCYVTGRIGVAKIPNQIIVDDDNKIFYSSCVWQNILVRIVNLMPMILILQLKQVIPILIS